MNKLKRAPCSYGWTDHAFNRQREWIIGNVKKNRPLKHRYYIRKAKRYISAINEILFRKPEPSTPF